MTKSKQAKNTPFERLLQKIKLDEYRAFILHYASKNTDFKTEFEVYFSGKDDSIDVSRKYAGLIQKLIRRYSDGGFVDYRASYGLAKEADRLLDTGYEMAGKKNFRDAFLMVKRKIFWVL